MKYGEIRVESLRKPKIELQNYIFMDEERQVWGQRSLGLQNLRTEEAAGDAYASKTSEICGSFYPYGYVAGVDLVVGEMFQRAF